MDTRFDRLEHRLSAVEVALTLICSHRTPAEPANMRL
jgi:hypothetical protein